MNRLWTKIKAFTLAELVIVMLIIAVVAGVSIKITKAKLDSVVSYTYYSAYNTLRSVAGEMMADSDASEEYGELSYNYKEKSLVDKFIDNYLIPKSYAIDRPICMEIRCPSNQIFNSVSCRCEKVACSLADRNKCTSNGGSFNATSCTCKYCSLADQQKCIADGGIFNKFTCLCKKKQDPQPNSCTLTDAQNCIAKGGTFDLTTCECSLQSGCDANQKTLCLAGGGTWSDSSCECSQVVQECANMADMVMCAAKHGVWSGYPNCTCNDGECDLTQNDCSKKQVLDKENCQCRDKKVTLPKTGKEFCEAFVSYTNTTTYNCNGNNSAAVSTAANSGNFADLAPDIVLRNGMKVYNAKNDYVKITALVGNSPIVYNLETNPLFIDSVFTAHSLIREKFAYLFHNLLEQQAYALPSDLDSSQPDAPDEEGLPPNLNEHGYIVYIDIDGSKGDSVLYEDVFPFYMTLEGRVVPAFKAGEEAGGNSTSHLTVSVQYDIYTSGDRRENWMSPKGTDFQHAACMSGYVTANTYCSGVDDAQLASKRAICSQTSSDCRMKVNKPLRF